jgi:tetratricopeptide (TPR) repeat protein
VVQQRVFLSAVSSEFKSAREALARALRAAGFHAEEQDTFVQLGAAPRLLRKLHDYIEGCFAVVCLIGSRTGAFPQPAEVAEFPNILPVAAASYTQWEYFLARHFNRRLYLYVATDAFPRDQDLPADPAQAQFIAHLVSDGIDRTPVADAPTFREQVLQALLRDRDAIPGTQVHQPIALPYPSLDSLFKGRAAFLTRLRDSLTRDNGGTAAIVSNAVHGMGGIGKTRAAVEYAWAYRKRYSALLFVQADTPDNLEANLAALTGPLRLAEAAATDQSVKLHAALAWLRTNPGWFLILDNVDTDAAKQAAVAMLGRLIGGHVVLTSRLDPGAWLGVEPLDLDVLGMEDAAAYLQEATEGRRLKRPDDAAQARSVAADLGQLALALTLAAATVRERQCSFADYRVLWAEAREKVRGWNQQTITGYHTAVGQTWQTSVAQVSAEARVLLERLAFLAPDPVPGFLLEGEVPGAASLNAREALLELARYSLLTREPEADRFTVHRLVQDATRRALNPARARERLTEALGWVNAAFAGDPQDVRNWGRLDPLTPHAEAVAEHADAAGIAEPTARLMNELGLLFNTKAAYARAEPLMRRALGIDEASYGSDHPRVASYLNNLALLLQATNRLGEAEPLMRRALGIDEASYGRDHPEVAIDLNNLAQLLQDTNRLGEAEPLMRRALGIDEASFGNDHPNVARDLNNLGRLLQATNRLGEAEPLMRRMVVIFLAFEHATGHAHPNRDAAIGNYAGLLAAMGKSEAEIAAAIAALRREAGPDQA